MSSRKRKEAQVDLALRDDEVLIPEVVDPIEFISQHHFVVTGYGLVRQHRFEPQYLVSLYRRIKDKESPYARSLQETLLKHYNIKLQ